MSNLMKRIRPTVLWLGIGVIVSVVLGCANEANLPTPNTNELALVELESVRDIPLLPTSNIVILAPGESIRIRDSEKTRYLCGNGNPPVCDRLNRNLYCSCSGSRRDR
jgi:hypothetical protein